MREVSIIQGPPGTGKSYVGVQLVRALLREKPSTRIFCLCYTNHALDSFLESLLDSGMSQDQIVRLGSISKTSERIQACCIQRREEKPQFDKAQSRLYFSLKSEIKEASNLVDSKANEIQNYLTSGNIGWSEISRFLNFHDYSAFKQFMVTERNDSTVVGKRGKAASKDYLWVQWNRGNELPAPFASLTQHLAETENLWRLSKEERRSRKETWMKRYHEDNAGSFLRSINELNDYCEQISSLRDESKLSAIDSARVVACTTTFAAKNHSFIESFAPNVMLVEEAAEILECHIMTSLVPSVQRLIMIGDHLQLRPKLESYALRTESGSGINFDRSLFERLVLSGYPYATLAVQHRMRPEISKLIRRTYPELRDASSVLNRSSIKGCYKNVSFINHSVPEGGQSGDAALLAAHESSSKYNDYEVAMVLKMAKYFLQQGYKCEDIVILTPYLGQLMRIRQAIRREQSSLFQIEIGERDKEDLLAEEDEEEDNRDQSGSLEKKAPSSTLRVATIDNFQGEESKIIITSLVRSNQTGDIGFVSGAERVNVLMSRARDGFFIIGNAETFRNSRSSRGRAVWEHVFAELERQEAILSGFPVLCEIHGRKQLIERPEEFDEKCPDGGCDQPCGKPLPSCPNGHLCWKRCHPLGNDSVAVHERIMCMTEVELQCSRGEHSYSRACHESNKRFECTKMVKVQCPNGHTVNLQCRKSDALGSVNWISECKTCKTLEEERKKEEEKTKKEMDALAAKTEQMQLAEGRLKSEVANEATKRQELQKQSLLRANMEAAEEQKALLQQRNEELSQSINIGSKARQTKMPAPKKDTRGVSGGSSSGNGHFGDFKVTESSTPPSLILAPPSTVSSTKATYAPPSPPSPPSPPPVPSTKATYAPPSPPSPPPISSTKATYYAPPSPPSPPVSSAKATYCAPPPSSSSCRESLPAKSTSSGSSQVKDILRCFKDKNYVDAFKLIKAADETLVAEELNKEDFLMRHRVDLVCFYLLCYDSLGEGDGLRRAFIMQEILKSTDRLVFPEENVLSRDLVNLLLDFTAVMLFSKLKDTAYLVFKHSASYLYSATRLPDQNTLWTTAWKESVEACELKAQDEIRNSPKSSAPSASPPISKGDQLKNNWKKLLKVYGVEEKKINAVDSLLHMTGLPKVKDKFFDLFKLMHISKEQGRDISSSNFNTRFDGNPGTGKTTVANLYATFLIEVGVLPEGAGFLKKTGSELATGGVSALEKELKEMKEKGGGVVFVDEAYQLNSMEGRRILDFILGHAERMKGEFGSLVWIFAGYANKMDELFQYNVGLPSRFPHKFLFEDYTDEELLSILKGIMERGGDDVPPPVVAPQKEKTTKQKAPNLSMNNNNNNPYNSAYYGGGGYVYGGGGDEQSDEWGNVWRWNYGTNTFEDDYGNVTGYGPSGLGEQRNPLVSSKTNTMWLYDRRRQLWYEQSNPSKTSRSYPGKPIPVDTTVKKKKNPFVASDEKWLRIAVRRLGRLRGTVGFGNARAVRNLFDLSHSRQVARIDRERSSNPRVNIFEFVRDDLLGPKPSKEVLQRCPAWQQLLKMEGLQAVKHALDSLFDLVVVNAEREEREEPLLDVVLNRIFLGNPGTGKTTVAKLYGEILVDLGLLSKGELVLKSASDLVGGAIGQSEEITRGILEQAKGCVLVIDEAYGLYQSVGSGNDPYREAIINTLVEQIQGVPGEDRAVLLLGYQEPMETMLAKCNPGLSRRFQLENAFHFEDYDDRALLSILRKAVEKSGLRLDMETAIFAVEQLAKSRARPNFGNAGAVNNLLSMAKQRMLQRRINNGQLVKEDFVPAGYSDEAMDVDGLLDRLVGCQNIRSQLQEYRIIYETCRKRGKDPKELLSFNYIFTGSPGTGKTTVARLLGKMFSSLQLIPFEEVIECSASDLMTGYVGQTGKQTRELFEKAKGKVLFIDEAYQLNPAKGGSFMQEAIDEIVKCLTHENYMNKMIVILAGYAKDMDEMLDANQGLRSRFHETIHFEDFDEQTIHDLICKGLEMSKEGRENLPEIARELRCLRSFANGRDVMTFIKRAKRESMLRGDESGQVVLQDLRRALEKMVKDRGMEKAAPARPSSHVEAPALPQMTLAARMNPPKPPSVRTVVRHETKVDESDPVEANEAVEGGDSLEQGFLNILQNELDKRGLNSAEGVAKLASYSRDDPYLKDLANAMSQALGRSPQEIMDLLIKWQGDQHKVQEEMEKQKEEEKLALKQKRKALVPIWRCGVCGRADKPYIACYVQPYIVRYEERDIGPSGKAI
eukprot:scaffold4308_cov162-Ochromonas_danica.AAC.4